MERPAISAAFLNATLATKVSKNVIDLALKNEAGEALLDTVATAYNKVASRKVHPSHLADQLASSEHKLALNVKENINEASTSSAPLAARDKTTDQYRG